MSTKQEDKILEAILRLGKEYTQPIGDSLYIPELNLVEFKRINRMLNTYFKGNEAFDFLKVFDTNDDVTFNSIDLVNTDLFDRYIDKIPERLFMLVTNTGKEYLTFFSDAYQVEYIWEIVKKEVEVVEEPEEEDETEDEI
jgi:hypothetical protein